MEHFILGVFVMSTGFKFVSSEYLIHNANKSIAEDLKRKVTVVCNVVMDLDVFDRVKRITAIESTWGRRCNKLIFLDDVDLNATRYHEKSMQQDQFYFRSLFEEHQNDGDWFLLVAARGYILLENLRYMLADYDPSDAIYFMPALNRVVGLKYVLSRDALGYFVDADMSEIIHCNSSNYDEVTKSNCMKNIGLRRMESRDALQRDRFLPQEPYNRMQKPGHHKFWDCRGSSKQKWDCFSDFAVSFDDVDTDLMYVIDYLIYQLRPYGINFDVKLKGLKNTGKKGESQDRRLYEDDDKEENELIQAPRDQDIDPDYEQDDDFNTVKSAEIKKGSWNKHKQNSVVNKVKITAKTKKREDSYVQSALEKGNWNKNERIGALNKEKIVKFKIKKGRLDQNANNENEQIY